MICLFREDLSQLGIEPARIQAKDDGVRDTDGTAYNEMQSPWGRELGEAGLETTTCDRTEARPDELVTMFAAADVEATDRARSYFAPFPPSSPQIALMKDKKVLFMLERHQNQDRTAEQIASELTEAFKQYCA